MALINIMSNHVSFQQEFVRFIRMNGDYMPEGRPPEPVTHTANTLFTVSVNPPAKVFWRVIQMNDGTTVKFDGGATANIRSVHVLTIPGGDPNAEPPIPPALDANTEYLVRVWKGDAANGTTSCEFEIKTNPV